MGLWFSSFFKKFGDTKSILDLNLWTETKYIADKPLFRLNANEIWGVIGQWIQNDVDYVRKVEELKRLFEEYSVSGAVVCLVCLERQEDIVLIENILKKDMKRYLTAETLKIMLDSARKWIKNSDAHSLRKASTDDMAQLIMEFPVQNLKKAISYEQVDGEEIMENPDEFRKIIKSATGWSVPECQQITEILLKRSSFTKLQILKNVEEIAMKNGLSQMIINKMKSTLFECDLENIHYQLRTKGIVNRKFSDSVLKLLNELSAEQMMDEDAIADYFQTISSALIMMIDTKRGKGYRPWQCVCCGNLNVHKNIGYKMVIDIPICSLCGVTQMEGITMAIKGINMPFQTVNGNVPNNDYEANEDQKDGEDDADSITDCVKHRQFDLHCMNQPDAKLCPSLKFMVKILREQKRYFMITEGDTKEKAKNLNVRDFREFLTVEEYKETLLNSVNKVMGEKQPADKDSVIETLSKIMDQNEEEICDFAPYFVGGGRKKLLNILKNRAAMSPGISAKTYKFAKEDLIKLALAKAPKRYQKWLEQLEVDKLKKAEEHIAKYHLKDVSRPKQMALYSFFNDALHFADKWDVKALCRNAAVKKQAIQEHDDVESAGNMLNRLYLELCHHDEKDSTEDSNDTTEDNGKVNMDKFVTKSDRTSYGFGVQQNYFHLKPRCTSIREELQCNEVSPVSDDVFMGILEKAVRAFCKKWKGGQFLNPAREHAAKHGILRNETVTVKHIAAVLSYTDLSEFGLRFSAVCLRDEWFICFVHSLCSAFRRTFRRIDNEITDKEVMDRHTSFYHMGRALMETGDYFGENLKQKEKVMHGLNEMMYFTSFTEYFNAPISTTQSKDVGTLPYTDFL